MYESYRVPKELLMKPIMKDIPIIKTNRSVPDIDIKSIPEFNIVDRYLEEYLKRYDKYLEKLFEKFGVSKEDFHIRVIAHPNGNPDECDVYIDGWYAFTLKDKIDYDTDGEHTTVTRTVTPYRRSF